ncbi:MAG: DUF488 family protein [Gammaproteobacteria bacterium]
MAEGATFLTIGHSNRSAATFVGLLKSHAVRLLVDIRAFPRSRRFPQYNRAVLEDVLNSREIAYYWLGDLLGGFRKPHADSPHTALTDAAFRGFADYMASATFAAGIADLLARAGERPTALMCAEADFQHCHRQFIADHLLARGIAVRHIIGSSESVSHRFSPCLDVDARPAVYNKHDQGDLFGGTSLM